MNWSIRDEKWLAKIVLVIVKANAIIILFAIGNLVIWLFLMSINLVLDKLMVFAAKLTKLILSFVVRSINIFPLFVVSLNEFRHQSDFGYRK